MKAKSASPGCERVKSYSFFVTLGGVPDNNMSRELGKIIA